MIKINIKLNVEPKDLLQKHAINYFIVPFLAMRQGPGELDGMVPGSRSRGRHWFTNIKDWTNESCNSLSLSLLLIVIGIARQLVYQCSLFFPVLFDAAAL